MIKIREAIVVEGRYDKNTIRQVVNAPILQTDGFAIMNNRRQLDFLRRVAAERGLIVFTDSDGAGFVIRNYLKRVIPPSQLKHAYIPDIYGKEKRKAAPGKEGKLGVEGMTPDVIEQCLLRAGATPEGEETVAPRQEITKQDLFVTGLSGGKDSSAKRRSLLEKLALPEHMSANALLQALNLLYTREEFFRLMEMSTEKQDG